MSYEFIEPVTLTIEPDEAATLASELRQAILKQDRKLTRRREQLGDRYDPALSPGERRLDRLEALFRKLGLNPEDIEVNVA